MPDDREAKIAELLSEAESAHGAYETAELGGVYDEQWPAWYAQYAVDHGLGAVLDHDVVATDLAALLTQAYADFEQIDPKQESWQTYIARRIAAEL